MELCPHLLFVMTGIRLNIYWDRTLKVSLFAVSNAGIDGIGRIYPRRRAKDLTLAFIELGRICDDLCRDWKWDLALVERKLENIHTDVGR